MPGPVDMPLIISQLANVQKISNSEVTKAGLQQTLMINPEEKEKNKKAQSQIQKTEKDEAAISVKDEENKGGQQHSPRKRQKHEEEPEEETQTKQSPWSGNIINVKI
ncbi:hypothetical protein [Desulfovibrio sp. JC010]|uniref:hypothetical protein n=1 Tax=Desulfovibrio sp. JC010 TaxID=2593641 RepID=UPI0013D05E18|nr:hypothetical protein [Desulfovibrio sp. JC010]NDV26977.1 hypothetical protein [Desulfovibrio sp. JC010]